MTVLIKYEFSGKQLPDDVQVWLKDNKSGYRILEDHFHQPSIWTNSIRIIVFYDEYLATAFKLRFMKFGNKN